MKRKTFIKKLIASGCWLKKHDIYKNPQNGKIAPVPRHSEIKESLCKLIMKQSGI